MVQRGDRIRNSARAYNTDEEIRKWWDSAGGINRMARSLPRVSQYDDSTYSMGVCLTEAIEQFKLVRIAGPLGDTGSDFQAQQIVEVMTLNSASDTEDGTASAAVGIAVDGLEGDETGGFVGLIATSGCHLCRIWLADSSHRYCDTNEILRRGGGFPKSAESGDIRIIAADWTLVEQVQIALVNLNAGSPGDLLFPVEVRKSSGEAGSLDDPCSFKYDILKLDTEELLESDVDPSPPSGLWKRTAIGAYVEADRGIAWNLTPTTYAIAWLNEVPEVAECEESQSIQMMWAGSYDESKSYPANNAVTDGPYMMVSNKQTDTKPAPQPLDEPETKIGTVPSWAQVSGAGYETITGQRYTWAKGGQLLKIRVYIPAPSGGGGGGGGPGGG